MALPVGNDKRVKLIHPATVPELTARHGGDAVALPLGDPAPGVVRAAVPELTELRRFDVDLAAGVLRVRRDVVRAARQ